MPVMLDGRKGIYYDTDGISEQQEESVPYMQ